jgi:hypothetical protein
LTGNPPWIQENLKIVEAKVRQEQTSLHDWEVDAEICDWVPDMGASRARDREYLKTVDLYWHIKTFLGIILLDNDDEHEAMQEQMNEMQFQIQDLRTRLDAQDRLTVNQQGDASQLQDLDRQEGQVASLPPSLA